jgi:hypothetical protein
MPKRALQVAIFYDRKVKECGANCGLDWSVADVAENAQRHVRQRFGKAVNLSITNLSEARKIKITPGENLNPPLLIINGVLRISGPFDLRQLSDAIEAEMEMQR